MARITRAAAHLSAEEVKQRMMTAPSAMYRQRWMIIYTTQIAPRAAAEIAKECGVSKVTVHALISTYNRLGIEAVETIGKGGRHNELLSWQQERELLTPFFARATEGQIATAGEIQRAYEQRVGHPVHQSTVYRLLERHGWRKLLPRRRHQQADPAEQERFKKTLRARWRRLWQAGPPKTSGPS
jgi:transposase